MSLNVANADPSRICPSKDLEESLRALPEEMRVKIEEMMRVGRAAFPVEPRQCVPAHVVLVRPDGKVQIEALEGGSPQSHIDQIRRKVRETGARLVLSTTESWVALKQDDITPEEEAQIQLAMEQNNGELIPARLCTSVVMIWAESAEHPLVAFAAEVEIADDGTRALGEWIVCEVESPFPGFRRYFKTPECALFERAEAAGWEA